MDICAPFSKDNTSQILSLVGFLCWSIWKSRCSFVYQGSPISPVDTISHALSLCYEFLNSQSLVSCHNDNQLSAPPPPNLIKINYDVAWFPSSNLADMGVIVHYHRGICIDGLTTQSSCALSLLVECKAVLAGVSFASNMSLPRVVVTFDN